MHDPQPGETYRHFKGGLYEIVARSLREDTLEPLVTYRSLEDGECWTRTLENFNGSVTKPRFLRLDGITVDPKAVDLINHRIADIVARRVQEMTSEEFEESLRSAGVVDSKGKLTPTYRRGEAVDCEGCGHPDDDHALPNQGRAHLPCEHPNCECGDFRGQGEDPMEHYEVVIDGRLRGKVAVPAASSPEEVEAAARDDAEIAVRLAGRPVGKVVVAPGKFIQFFLEPLPHPVEYCGCVDCREAASRAFPLPPKGDSPTSGADPGRRAMTRAEFEGLFSGDDVRPTGVGG